ncbi:putative DNA base hypermodification protein [Novosphingobium sp. 1949]|uniref:DNA base hypermodification protein n=1 Tax=Novosphingobium organovorum TaxID=2930092 RepID=A0ABT0BF62_9SPHN|nr:nucleotide kinase domain-containing protein [Novosphingobium organovorum]MCJ2183700.1 putative DNA base hypermodification protein [Novosphingobium organovorum]
MSKRGGLRQWGGDGLICLCPPADPKPAACEQSMIPTEVFDTYWKFAAERQAVYFRRLSDPVGPWTHDPIISTYRFTNAYRAADRVSQYLIREVQYHPERSAEPDEVFFRTLLFKVFNKIETWKHLEREAGPVRWRDFNFEAVNAILDKAMSAGARLYSAAYIMPAPKFGYARKHTNHLALLSAMMKDRVPDRIRQLPTLSNVYEILLGYSGIGKFLAFQYAIDLNYSSLIDHDEADFVIAGPGALDGLAKCFSSLGKHSPEEAIHWICDQQEQAFRERGLDFQTLYGRRLQPIDCQNLLCEISKYARVAHPSVPGVSGRTRIKQSYRPSADHLIAPLFPPKWGLSVQQSTQDRPRIRPTKLGLFS